MTASATETACALIEMRDVQLRHPDIVGTWRVNGVNWRIEPGDFWAVGGLQWSGKTNLLLAAAGVNSRIRGSLSLFGREFASLDEEERTRERLRIGLVFGGDGRLLANLSIAENIALPLRYLQGEDSETMGLRVTQLMEALDLVSVAAEPAGSVSLNHRRRAALARAVVLEPEALLFDQPFEGLDPRQRRWWRDLIRDLHAGSSPLLAAAATLVLATEDLRPWVSRANRFALLGEGTFQVVGDRDAMKACDLSLARELHLQDSARD